MLKKYFFILISIITIHIGVIMNIGLYYTQTKSELGVVFGNTVNKDGTVSNRLKARLDTSIRLYEKGIIEKIFVSGGLGKEGFYEGEKMAEYLISKSIPKESIIIDNKGNTTKDTVKNSLVYAQDNNIKNIVGISQYFHLARIRYFYHIYGNLNVVAAAPLYFEFRDVYSIPREIIAIYVAFFRR